MKKITYIFPHIIILLGARLVLILGVAFLPYLWGLFIADYNSLSQEELLTSILLLPIFTIGYGTLEIFAIHFLWHHCFGEIIVTKKEIIYFGLFLPIIRLKFDQIKYVEIRTFDEGNVAYPKAMRLYENYNVDMYKFILISENPLPRKRIDKIRPSRKNKLIKYAVSKKLCKALVDKLPEMQARVVDYQLHLYKKAKK